MVAGQLLAHWVSSMPNSKHNHNAIEDSLCQQTFRRSGYTVITTCSPRNFEYVKSLGAEFVVDYNDANAGAQIREFTNNELKYAWDTVSIEASARICADALSTTSAIAPVYGSLLPVKSPRNDVEAVSTVMHTVFGKDFKFGPLDMPANQEDFQFGKMFFQLTEELLAQVSCSHPAHIYPLSHQ